MTSLRALLLETPPAWLAPALAAGALAGALAAWLVTTLLWRVVTARRRPPATPFAALADGAPVTLHGTLAAADDGAPALRTRDAAFALEGPAALALALAPRAGVIVRGTYHRRPAARSGEAYRDPATLHTLTDVTLAPLRPPAPARVVFPLALAAALAGALAGALLPARVVPATLAAPLRRPRLRVRSLAPSRAVLERVAAELDPSCPQRLRAPARWGVDRAECEPTETLLSPAPALPAFVPARLAGPSPRADGRAVALALGWPALAAALAAVPGDARAYRTAVRESFAAGDHDAVWRYALEAPAATHPDIAAEVITTWLFTRRHEPAAADLARRVAAAAPAGTPESLACIAAFWSWPAGRAPAEALSWATRPGAPPACVILGATTARRGLDSLRPLEGLPRTHPVWRPLIDAAKNFVLLEGLASGAIRAPAPSRLAPFGDPAELRSAMSAGVAHLVESAAGIAESRGYLRLAWDARFPAREAIVRALLLDLLPNDPALASAPPAGLAAAWIDRTAGDYRRALEAFPAAAARDPRLNPSALARLRDDAARFTAETDRLRALAAALDTGDAAAFTTFLRTLDPRRVDVVRAALRADDPRAFARALGDPTPEALALAAALGLRDPPTARSAALTRAWLFDALRREDAARSAWRDHRRVRAFAHRHANQEWAARDLTLPAGAPRPGPYGLAARPWVDPAPHAGAFVLAVTEALQRSLAR